ncbi:MAG TPA: EamA family transporter [Thermoleophilaceae bacterium]
MLAIALGLAASASWGCSDFLGGLKSRTLQLLTVLLISQGAGLALVAVVVAVRGEPVPDAKYVAYACLSGVAGAMGLAAFYRGLAVGAMAVVAPIAGTAAVIPVAFGVLTGDRPSGVQAVGIALAIAGVAIASRELPEEGGSARVAAGAGLALLAAVGFGSFFVSMDAASDSDVFWAIFFNRVTSIAVLGLAALVARPRLKVARADMRALLAIGALDISANALFAAASTEGLVSLVAVLASLYPVVTILLARVVLGEHVRRVQQAGIASVLAGVALISAG